MSSTSVSVRPPAPPLPRGLRGALLSTLLIASCLLSPAAADAVGPVAPHLRISSSVTPSHLTAGDDSGFATYTIRVVNDGAAPTDGSAITITDQLPAGAFINTAAEFPIANFSLFFVPGEEILPCEESPVPTCTVEKVLQPGYTLQMEIPIKTAADLEAPALNRAEVSGGGAPAATVTESTPVTTEPAGFDFQSLSTAITDADGSPFSQAGGHPYQFQTGFELGFVSKEGGDFPAANLRSATAKLPKGFVLNPQATPVRCTEAEFEVRDGHNLSLCPDAAAVGVAYPTLGVFGFANPFASTPIYNLVPPAGTALMLGFSPSNLNIYAHLIGGVDSAGEYTLTAGAQDLPVYGATAGIKVELWGDPSDPSHDGRRGHCGSSGYPGFCPVEPTDVPLLTMPGSCSQGPPTTAFSAYSWQDPGDVITGSAPATDEEGNPVGVDGCNSLEFKPKIFSQPTTDLADSPSGLDFNLHQPQSSDFEGLATAILKDAEVTLPPGLTLNPSAGNGLGSCSEGQIGYQPSAGKIHFSASPQSCPDAAKLGTMEVSTPLLDHTLPGAVYLAKPYANPFGSLLAIYLAVEDEQTGIVAKLAGKVTPDPQTGQLTATFTENPELPIEDFSLHFFNGPRAALKTPLACGSGLTTSTLTPWSTPEGQDAHPSDSFQTQVAAGGAGNCPSSEAQAPNKPSFTAGTAAPEAGAYSPFLLKLSRPDGSQRLTGIDTTLPPGLTGKLVGIPYCSEAQIAAAKSREAPNMGALEQQSPSCPAASEVGTVTVGAGAGITPLYVGGHAYLAGPYKGAPLSLAIITPAVAGPFDLGAVVVRTALYVDSESARIHAVSDPLPTIIQGIPLDLRSIAVRLDRPGFTLNPTSCDPMPAAASITSATGYAAPLVSLFQVGGCPRLGFEPGVGVRLLGPTHRGAHPGFRTVLTARKGDANLRRVAVTLPPTELLDSRHIGTVCTRTQFAAEQCPESSVYGHAKAWTPLLGRPLAGPVYLRASDHRLPDLVASLDGQVQIDLVGRVDSVRGRIRSTFQALPDVPLSKVVLTMGGGRRGLFVNTGGVCARAPRADVGLIGHSAKSQDLQVPVKRDCRK